MKKLLLLALAACHHSPPANDSGDAVATVIDAGDTCVTMCANLATIGCREGADPKCVAVCTHDLEVPVSPMPLSCWTSATTKEAARACGDSYTGHLACP